MRTQETHRTVTDYLAGLIWDGTPRLDRWLIDYAGAEDIPRVRAVSRAMLVAAVRRARDPGCRFDQLPVIEGPQGCGKSSALRMLAIDEAWFSDHLPAVADVRKLMEATAGKWIIEATELNANDAAQLKSFLSRTHDEARMAYQRETTRMPRGFVVIGTTGSSDYLRDTGNRRFWPVSVRSFDLKRLASVRDQLWAEAAIAEATGESIYLATETETEEKE